ncbi:globin domain-containing protein [Nocardioides bruguierae]|uniref:globin domain-containing protein n=1 Tax=Nocardioides bruguierae TaxID=2945102 RepID=UPI0020225B9C|nr:oxidoreductase [Nocardioides bruguierae]MCL8026543.1 oxidoreductase [Nocardioides bruguierae]
MEQALYTALGGADVVAALARAWHARVLADPVVSHAFSHGFHPAHEDRLAAYLGEVLGGPATFTGGARPLGTESQVVRDHSGNGEHPEMDDRAIACWQAALVDVGVPEDAVLHARPRDWFAWATRVQMAAYPRSAEDVPEGLARPTWTWDGPPAG